MTTPLNEEAFDLACKELFLTITAHKSAADVLGFDWKSLKASTRKPWETATRKVLTAYLEAVAQPAVNTVEDVPASLHCISWEEEPEYELWKITEDETFVGLIIKAGRSWSPADKYTLRIERPEVNDA